MTKDADKPDKSDKQMLELKIDHARLEPGEEPQVMTFPKTMKVGDAAAQAAATLGYSTQGTYTFSFKGETLERNRTLVSYSLHDGDTVTLTDLGRAV